MEVGQLVGLLVLLLFLAIAIAAIVMMWTETNPLNTLCSSLGGLFC